MVHLKSEDYRFLLQNKIFSVLKRRKKSCYDKHIKHE